jgi:hypothetical protein
VPHRGLNAERALSAFAADVICANQLVSEAKKFTSFAKRPLDVINAWGSSSQGVISVRFLPMMLTPFFMEQH